MHACLRDREKGEGTLQVPIVEVKWNSIDGEKNGEMPLMASQQTKIAAPKKWGYPTNHSSIHHPFHVLFLLTVKIFQSASQLSNDANHATYTDFLVSTLSHHSAPTPTSPSIPKLVSKLNPPSPSPPVSVFKKLSKSKCSRTSPGGPPKPPRLWLKSRFDISI